MNQPIQDLIDKAIVDRIESIEKCLRVDVKMIAGIYAFLLIQSAIIASLLYTLFKT